MLDNILRFLERIEPDKKKSPLLHTAYDAFHTFAFTPNTVTKGGVHLRDTVDLKRTMFFVVIALQLCYLFGTYNIGHQHFVALGQHVGFMEGFHLKLVYGLIQMIPIFVVANVVGLGIEFLYAARKGHPVEEGYLVTGALIPLIMPPDIPLWMLTVSIVFAVIVGKEAFGGTGMNVLNIALLSRVFIFFAYPTEISGDNVWVAGLEQVKDEGSAYYGMTVASYHWAHDAFNSLFAGLDLATFNEYTPVRDGYTGATPLSLAWGGGWERVTEHYSESQMLWGTIPGSIGESNKIFVLLGAVFLMVTGVGSWRIMLSCFIGAALVAMGLNLWGATPFMEVPWHHQFLMGSFVFAMAFMATDPVTASSTSTGKLWYGFGIGAIGMIIRVVNPAYPEGWMLSILFMNVFAPLIDHYVLDANISRRKKRKRSLATATTYTPESQETTTTLAPAGE